MKITELLSRGGRTLSFEVFPPKTDSGFAGVKAATEEIAALGPSFVSVTYGAGGGTSRYTLEIARNIRDRFGVPTLAHLTCVSGTKESVKERIEAMKEAGIENVMALRGDLTEEMKGQDRAGWDYRYAVDLVPYSFLYLMLTPEKKRIDRWEAALLAAVFLFTCVGFTEVHV